MASASLNALVRDLKKFNDSKAVVKGLRKEIRAPIPAVRKKIRRRAIDTLPKRGGLNRWVARTRITARIKLTGRGAGVKMIGARKSSRAESDVKRIDAGRVRHPSWGRRFSGQWHVQSVRPGFFTDPSTEVDQWREACERAVDKALRTIQ